MNGLFRWLLLVSIGFAVLGLLSAAETTPVDFVKEVKPILDARCVSCHGPTKQRSGLRLDRKEDALKGGDSGPAIVPGKAADSPLLQRLLSMEKNERMPPAGDRLSADQVAVLRKWIDQGATWPATETTDDPKKGHWAFQPVRRPPVPPVADARWPSNAIDHFIRARLEKDGLTPAPEADRPALIRRLKFDLLGLPPTPEEVDAFVAISGGQGL